MTPTLPLGAHLAPDGTRFAVRAPHAEQVWLCLFDDGAAERRVPMTRAGADWMVTLADAGPGQRYGYRAAGPWAPEQGLQFDPAKLLVDPHAVTLDRRFRHDPRLALRGEETAGLVPRAIVTAPLPPLPPAPPRLPPGGLVYELNVRAFTMRHPDVPEAQRGTIAALAHPAVLAHLRRIGVDAVELMPIAAWIDERHLGPLGLANAWGYNPVVPMAIDPGLAPGGIAELRATVAALHAAGIGTILDLVFNHTGESDADGPTLSLRGLDGAAYARAPDGRLINDTGTGNTLDFSQDAVRELTLATMRHFVTEAGVDGFRFDLATVLARGPGFDPAAPLFAEIAADPLLADRILIAEPWDIGPGGYQLGHFPPDWLEWNDRYRDDVRRFWRGDPHMAGTLATRLCGSPDVFGGSHARGVSFVAAHDGFTLADVTAYVDRHNHANGENGRDGHGDNFSWNGGAEGPSDDPAVHARRDADRRALLTTLFATRGTIQLTAGDEFGRTQAGNNNAYAQDNAIGWIDWAGRDLALEAHVSALAAIRRAHPEIGDPLYHHHLDWRALDGQPMSPARWDDPACAGFVLLIPLADGGTAALRVDRTARTASLSIEEEPA